jgi:hypothetical protein
VSPSPNSRRQGRTKQDLERHIRVLLSTSEVHGQIARQPCAGLDALSRFALRAVRGHRCSLDLQTLGVPAPKAYGTCRSHGKGPAGLSHRSLDGRRTGAAHRSHRPGGDSRWKKPFWINLAAGLVRTDIRISKEPR